MRRAAAIVAASLALTGARTATGELPGDTRLALTNPSYTTERFDLARLEPLIDAWAQWAHWLEVNPYIGPECPGRWPIPTSIVWRESRCTNAENPTSSASGPYQMIDGSWHWAVEHAGYTDVWGHASYAPLDVQAEAAHALWLDSPCHWAPNDWCN